MKTKWMLLLIGTIGLNASAALAQSSGPVPMVVPSVTGTLRLQQSTPATCDGVDQTRAVTSGRIEISPAEGTPLLGMRFFILTRATMTFAPFFIHVECVGKSETRDYTQLAVDLAGPVPFVASSSSPGVYTFTIPKGDVLLYEAAIVNGNSETSYRNPKEDVTGTLNLNLGTISIHVVGATKIHVDPDILFGDYSGTLTADLAGTIAFPDRDSDGVPDRTDNCPLVPNADQTPVDTPLLRAPIAVTVHSCVDHRIGPATAADLCDGGPVTVTNDEPPRFLVGANLVTWSAEDAKSRVTTATQTVTVVDTTPPVITSVPPDVHLTNCGPADLGLPTATDDCAGTVTFTNNAPGIFLVGTTTVVWTAADVSGNHTNDTQDVTVVDTVAPTVSCVPAGPPGGTFQVSSSDACAAPIIRLGSFVLANNERIKINEVGQSGIRLVNVIGPDNIKHFHVGRGEAIITATDPSGNVSSLNCLP